MCCWKFKSLDEEGVSAPPAIDPPAGPEADFDRKSIVFNGFRRGPRLGPAANGAKAVARASLLNAPDRMLVTAMYEKGMSAHQIGELLGMSAAQVRRRASRLVRHVNGPLVSFILAERHRWTPQRRHIAELRLVQRRTLRQTVEATGLGPYRIRSECQAILAQYEAAVEP